jgi:Domain of unknown function (DUF4347)/Calx-beta domain/FG-GAP-like repeat/Bacterial pre-peptidase C-terminal domain/FG-GAP repeat
MSRVSARLRLQSLEDRVQPAVVHPLRVALISNAVGPMDQVLSAVPKDVIPVTFDAGTSTLDGLVNTLGDVSAAHLGAPISQLALMAHGQAGGIVLGSADTVNAFDVASDSAIWAKFRGLLDAKARIDLYACNVASGTDGKAFVNALAERTGAVVYASDDPVGRGGDFAWEYHTLARPRASMFRTDLLKKIKTLNLGEDGYEENDSIAVTASRPEGIANSPNLGPITGNKLVQAAMEDDNDFYRFTMLGTGRANDFVSIAFPYTSPNLDIYLFDSAGTQIDAAGSYNATDKISLESLKAGTYYVDVVPKDSAQLGTLYDLQIVAPPDTGDDAYEPNDTRAQVDVPGNPSDLGVVTGSRTLSGLVLDDPGNADWFKFTLAGTGRPENFVSIAFTTVEGQLDIYLFDAAGIQLDGAGSYNPTDSISLDALKAGTYYVAVVPKSSYRPAMASYDLQINAPQDTGDDAYEPNDTRAQVDGGSPADLGTVAGSRSLIGLVLDDPMSADWFKFTTTATGTAQDFVNISFETVEGQLDLYLFNSAGAQIGSAGSYNPTDQISLNGFAANTYYVAVVPKSGYRPAMATYDLQIKAPGTGLSVSDVTVVEGTGGTNNAVFTVSMSQASASTVTVNYSTQVGSADGTDFSSTSGVVTFNPGETSKPVNVPITTDSTPEADEQFYLKLSGASTGVINRGTGVGTILDDDTAGKIQFSATSFNTTENAGTATIYVTRVGGASGSADVSFTTSNGTAAAGADYTFTAGVLHFGVGETVKSFSVPILADTVDPEATETVILTLSGPTGGAVLGSPAAATLFIQNATATTPGNASLVVGADAGTQPRVRVYNGETLINDFYAYPSGFLGGVRVATGDVNGDGTPDIVTAPGAGISPEVKVFDGKTGLQIGGGAGSLLAYASTFLGGVFVAVGDVDKDGHADIITGPNSKLGPTVNVFSGADGHMLGAIPSAFASSFKGGVRVAAGDVDGDGYSDIIATTGSGTAVRARVFSGKELAANHRVLGLPGILGNGKLAPLGTLTSGAYVSAADLNGDGKAELIVGAGKGASTVTVLNGLDGTVLKTFTALASTLTGGVRVATGDVNGDGEADILVAPGGVTGGSGAIRAYDGITYQEIDLTAGTDPLWPFGELFDKGLFVAGSGA